MGHRINEVFFFYKKMYGRFVKRLKNSGRNNTGGRKAGFQVATHDSILQPNVMVKTVPPSSPSLPAPHHPPLHPILRYVRCYL